MKFLYVLVIALAASIVFAETPNLRVGIVSDTQSYPGRETWGQKNLWDALKYLKTKNIDVLIYAGDIANDGHVTVYREYHETMDDVFGKKKPETVIIMGNHDFWLNNKHDTPGEKGIATFKEGMKQDSINTHKVVKGYDFIAVGAENTYLSSWNKIYGDASRKFMADEMAAALARAPEKPVFVVTHEHAKGTVIGVEGHPVITEMLTPYPNAVHFSGHSHFPLEDERSIHQRDFTALETSSLNYCDLGKGRENAPNSSEGRSCVQFIYMEVFDNRIDFHRMNLRPGIREIKPGKLWSVPLPLTKESFRYTDKRADGRTAPVFAAGARLEAAPDKVPFTGIKLKFDAAKHDDFVYDYAVDLQERRPDGTWGEGTRLRFFSDFYRGLDRMAPRPELVIQSKHFNGNSEYRITVSAAESFGKTGNALTTTVKTPERAPIPEKK